MNLTDKTDFSLRVLMYLAAVDGDRTSVRRLAEVLALSEAHLAKCVQGLAQAGFVDTVVGRGGGVTLARPPAEIRIGDVVRALEPMVIVECFGAPPFQCRLLPGCGLKGALHRARAAFLAELDGVTLAAVAGDGRALRDRLS